MASLLFTILGIIYILFKAVEDTQDSKAETAASCIGYGIGTAILVLCPVVLMEIIDFVYDRFGLVWGHIASAIAIVACVVLILMVLLHKRNKDRSDQVRGERLRNIKEEILKAGEPDEATKEILRRTWFENHDEYLSDERLIQIWRDQQLKELFNEDDEDNMQ